MFRHALSISASVLKTTVDTSDGKLSLGRSGNSFSGSTGLTFSPKDGIHCKNVPISLATLSVKQELAEQVHGLLKILPWLQGQPGYEKWIWLEQKPDSESAHIHSPK